MVARLGRLSNLGRKWIYLLKKALIWDLNAWHLAAMNACRGSLAIYANAKLKWNYFRINSNGKTLQAIVVNKSREAEFVITIHHAALEERMLRRIMQVKKLHAQFEWDTQTLWSKLEQNRIQKALAHRAQESGFIKTHFKTHIMDVFFSSTWQVWCL